MYLVERLAARLERRAWSVAVAESCTGGLLAATLVAHPNTSTWFERGFVVYSNDSKCELLGIERPEVESCDGVGETIARYMARAAWVASRADLSVAITGFAGPRQSDEEVGLLHIAAATKASTHHAVHHLGDIGREAISRRAVDLALAMLIAATMDERPVSVSAEVVWPARVAELRWHDSPGNHSSCEPLRSQL